MLPAIALSSDPDHVVAVACQIIKRFEGCELTAYPDPASALAVQARQQQTTPEALLQAGADPTTGHPWTIGWGSTGHLDGSAIQPGETWTQMGADLDLARRVGVLLTEVGAVVTAPLPDEAYAALMSLAYNIGFRAEERSLSTHGLLEMLNAGDYAGAAQCFMAYDHAAGRVDEGLVKRRVQERDLFLSSCAAAGLTQPQENE
jgi:lysozyme